MSFLKSLWPFKLKEKEEVGLQRWVGRVKWFCSKKGYGFANCPALGEDVFVHVTDLVNYSNGNGNVALPEGAEISFTVRPTTRGLRAYSVERV